MNVSPISAAVSQALPPAITLRPLAATYGVEADLAGRDAAERQSFVPDRDSGQVQLAYADIVVAGGWGLKSAENFELIKELAGVLKGEYGASRPLMQKGWIPAERQIGQTGKTIRPKLYIAAGISGAVQR